MPQGEIAANEHNFLSIALSTNGSIQCVTTIIVIVHVLDCLCVTSWSLRADDQASESASQTKDNVQIHALWLRIHPHAPALISLSSHWAQVRCLFWRDTEFSPVALSAINWCSPSSWDNIGDSHHTGIMIHIDGCHLSSQVLTRWSLRSYFNAAPWPIAYWWARTC